MPWRRRWAITCAACATKRSAPPPGTAARPSSIATCPRRGADSPRSSGPSKELPRARRQAPGHRGELLSAGELGLAEAVREPRAHSGDQRRTAGSEDGVDLGGGDPGAREHIAHDGIDVVELGNDPLAER